MNTCPIFKRVGGHEYNYVIPGPIGSNLGSSRNIKEYGKLAFASTLCGSCTAVCPVKINLHEQLLAYRGVYKSQVNESKDKYYKLASKILANPKVYRALMSFAKYLPHWVYKGAWGKGRVTPKLAKKSFKDYYESL